MTRVSPAGRPTSETMAMARAEGKARKIFHGAEPPFWGGRTPFLHIPKSYSTPADWSLLLAIVEPSWYWRDCESCAAAGNSWAVGARVGAGASFSFAAAESGVVSATSAALEAAAGASGAAAAGAAVLAAAEAAVEAEEGVEAGSGGVGAGTGGAELGPALLSTGPNGAPPGGPGLGVADFTAGSAGLVSSGFGSSFISRRVVKSIVFSSSNISLSSFS